MADEVLLRSILLDADFFLLSSFVQRTLCPLEQGLYSGMKDSSSQPWVLFLEKRINARAVHPVEGKDTLFELSLLICLTMCSIPNWRH
jgi:hypothetical protein